MATRSTLTRDPAGIHGQDEPGGTRRASCPCLHALRKLVRVLRFAEAPWLRLEPIEHVCSTSHGYAVTSSLGLGHTSPHLNVEG